MSDVNPYESSTVAGPASSGTQSGRAYSYVSAAGRVSTLIILFVVTGVWHAVMIGMNLVAVLGDVDAWGEIQLGDMLYPSFWITYAAAGLLILPIYIATVVVFCMWVHRSNANARALGAEGMEFTPGWSVGWFFIPIMNLFKPYQAVREIYRASDPERGPRDWPLSGNSGAVRLWWTLWIVTNIIDNVESRMGQADDPEMLLVSCWVGVVGSALGILLCLVVANVVRSIQARLHRKAIQLGAAMEFSD